MTVLYEDNHIIAVNKSCKELVQGDKTGDVTLIDLVKQYIKEKYMKPGEVFLGLPHRLDRPTSGVVLFARTSKALTRLNELFRSHTDVKKTYWAVVRNAPKQESGRLEHYLYKNEKQNKSYVCAADRKGAKKAVLNYRTVAHSDNYYLLEVELETGRHHQIRCQLAHIGCPIRGDLKYGYSRSNADGGISLHARSISFVHPVSKLPISIEAPVPSGDRLWQVLEALV